jgi:hypothetical protein
LFFSRTSGPKSIKLGTNYPWVKEIQVCSNKGPGPLQRGDNHKNLKMEVGNLNIFSRTTSLILNRLGTNHPRIERIQMSLKEGDSPSSRGDNHDNSKNTPKIFKNLFLQNEQAKINQIWYKLSFGGNNSSLFQ